MRSLTWKLTRRASQQQKMQTLRSSASGSGCAIPVDISQPSARPLHRDLDSLKPWSDCVPANIFGGGPLIFPDFQRAIGSHENPLIFMISHGVGPRRGAGGDAGPDARDEERSRRALAPGATMQPQKKQTVTVDYSWTAAITVGCSFLAVRFWLCTFG